MILQGIIKHGDFVLHKTNRRTFPWMNIGGFTEALNEDICKENNTDPLNGFNHIQRVDEDVDFIIHATPPRCAREKLTPRYRKKMTKRNDIEIWRLKEDIGEERQRHITREFYRLADLKWNKKKKKFIGLKYDWWALLFSPFAALFGIGLNARNMIHCAEIVFDSALCEDIILSSQGRFDPLVSPNNIINSGLLKKVWSKYL